MKLSTLRTTVNVVNIVAIVLCMIGIAGWAALLIPVTISIFTPWQQPLMISFMYFLVVPIGTGLIGIGTLIFCLNLIPSGVGDYLARRQGFICLETCSPPEERN